MVHKEGHVCDQNHGERHLPSMNDCSTPGSFNYFPSPDNGTHGLHERTALAPNTPYMRHVTGDGHCD